MIAGLPATHEECRYRCFLPDLAEFAILRCAGPGYQTVIGDGGEGEIRTHGSFYTTTVFKTVPINRSGTYPYLVCRERLELSNLSELGVKPSAFAVSPPTHIWWVRRDSNPQAFRHMLLRHTCIPIPPPTQIETQTESNPHSSLKRERLTIWLYASYFGVSAGT